MGTKLLFSRWFVLLPCMIFMIVGGTGYAFGVWSRDLKSRLNYSQPQIDNLSFASNVGTYFPTSGFFFDRFGPKWTIVLGALQNSAGYFLLWMVSSGRMNADFIAVCFICFLWGHGGGWFDTAVIGTTVRNFPEHRGLAVGLMKAFFGLSAGIVTEYYTAIFKPNPVPFLLFIAIGLDGLAMLLSPLINVVPPCTGRSSKKKSRNVQYQSTGHGSSGSDGGISGAASASDSAGDEDGQSSEALLSDADGGATVRYSSDNDFDDKSKQQSASRIKLGLVLVLMLAAYLGIIGTISAVSSSLLTHNVHLGLMAGLCVLLINMTFLLRGSGYLTLRIPLGEVPGVAHKRDEGSKPLLTVSNGGNSQEPHSPVLDDSASRKPQTFAVGDNLSPSQTVQLPEFWLHFMSSFAMAGAGLTLINNMAQMVESLGGVDGDQNTFLTFLSVANSCGRMAMGLLTDRYRQRLTRPWFLSVVLISTTLTCVYIAFSNYAMLYFGSAVMGFTYGCFWVLQPSITSELFGLSSFGSHYTMMGTGTLGASYLLSTLMTSSLYDDFSTGGTGNSTGNSTGSGSNNSGDSNTCLGVNCFRYTWLGIAGVCLLGSICATWNYFRTKRVYSMILEKEAAAADAKRKQTMADQDHDDQHSEAPEWNDPNDSPFIHSPQHSGIEDDSDAVNGSGGFNSSPGPSSRALAGAHYQGVDSSD